MARKFNRRVGSLAAVLVAFGIAGSASAITTQTWSSASGLNLTGSAALAISALRGMRSFHSCLPAHWPAQMSAGHLPDLCLTGHTTFQFLCLNLTGSAALSVSQPYGACDGFQLLCLNLTGSAAFRFACPPAGSNVHRTFALGLATVQLL